MKRNHLVCRWWHMVTVDKNKPPLARTTTWRPPNQPDPLTGTGTCSLLDHVCGVRSGAAAAVRTQQTAHVSRVVGREVRDTGAALQTPRMVFLTPGRPAGVEQKVTFPAQRCHPRTDVQSHLRTWALRRNGLFRGDSEDLDFAELIWIREACGSVFIFIG